MPAVFGRWFSHSLLPLTVLLAGIGTLGIEMVMPRLLSPFFGTSQPIWAVVIGVTLLYLALGAWLGGRLADRWPDQRLLYQLISWAGLSCGLIPIMARPILSTAQQAMLQFSAASFLGALAAVILLFAVPVVLMAMVTPFALRLTLPETAQGLAATGRTAGNLSALSTIGSIAGTFLTVLVLIPAIGTERTLYLFALFLLLLGMVGLRDWRYSLLVILVLLLAYTTLNHPTPIKSVDCYRCTLLAEAESAYNYIQVVQQDIDPQRADDDRMYLFLNEGQAIHSLYRPIAQQTADPLDTLTGGGPWDYFSVAPYVYPQRQPQEITSLAMLGAAVGTTPRQFLAIYGDQTRIDAVEIDPRIIELGYQFFALEAGDPRYPNYRVYAQDGRTWLAGSASTYDVIGIDAYHQPYIPFHLTTVEFFHEIKQHLNERGVAVVNAARTPSGNDLLVQALASTMRTVFPQVFIIDARQGEGHAANAILIGTRTPVGDGVAHFGEAMQRIEHPALRQVMYWAMYEGPGPVREFTPDQAQFAPFTDDHAPVEQLIDQMILEEAQRLSRDP